MKFSKTVEIAKPVDQVWRIFAVEFDMAYVWMASVPRSFAKTEGPIAKNAPMPGRICHLSSSETKNMVDEVILEFDEQRHVFKFVVSPLHMPAVFPFSKNRIRIEMSTLKNGNTKMHWDLNTQLKFAGYMLYPLVKVGLSKGIDNIIEELKYFVENVTPNTRTQAKNANAVGLQ